MKKWLLGWLGSGVLFLLPVLGASVQIGANFTGSTFGVDSTALPSDTTGAIGPAHFVELVNGHYAVYDKKTGQMLQSMSDESFWTNWGVTLSRSISVTDPRVIYDAASGRWFASMVDVNTRRQRANRFLLAVSTTSDPTASWNTVTLPAAGGLSYFADFPTLGVDTNAVYLSGDLFDLFETPTGPIVLAIPKSSLLASQPTITGLYSSGALSYDSRGNILQPAVVTGEPTTPEVLLAVGDLGLDFAPHSTLILTPFNTTNGTFSLGAPVTLTVPSYEIPINPTQPGGIDSLDNGDARISAHVRRVGDTLYATHCIEAGNRAAIRWYRINAAQLTLIESGTITNSDLELFYPSIAANTNGTVVIGCNGTSSNQFISSYAYVGRTTNGVLSFEGPMLLKTGLASYDTHDNSGTSRWGDYSATTVDPEDSNRFWTIQSFPVDATTWATQITEVLTGPASPAGPTLSITSSAQGLEISWPGAEGEALQFSPTLAPANWQDVSPSPTVTNGIATVTISPTATSGFYRVLQR